MLNLLTDRHEPHIVSDCAFLIVLMFNHGMKYLVHT